MSFPSSLCLGFRRDLNFISFLLPSVLKFFFTWLGLGSPSGLSIFSGSRSVYPFLSFGRHWNAFFACVQVVDCVDPFLYSPLLGGRLGFKFFGLCPLVMQVFFNCPHAFTVAFRDEQPFDSFPFSFFGIFFPKNMKSPLCFPQEGFFNFSSYVLLDICLSSQRVFLSQGSRLFFFSFFPWPIQILFHFAFPFSFSDVYFLVGIFFSKGNSHFSVFSFIMTFFWILSQNSLLPDPLKYGARLLVGWKIFVPSRGEFGLGSFKFPPLFLFEQFFCLWGFLFGVPRGGKWFSSSPLGQGFEDSCLEFLLRFFPLPRGLHPLGQRGRLVSFPSFSFLLFRLFQSAQPIW